MSGSLGSRGSTCSDSGSLPLGGEQSHHPDVFRGQGNRNAGSRGMASQDERYGPVSLIFKRPDIRVLCHPKKKENQIGREPTCQSRSPSKATPARRDTERRKTQPSSRLGGEARVTPRPQPDDRWTEGGTGRLTQCSRSRISSVRLSPF